MTSYELEDELISRTLNNLRAVEKLSQEDKSVYEVTQLINSLLGLLVYPNERLKKIPEITWETMIKEGWPLPLGENAQVSGLKQLIKYMRHAVAHFNIEFITEENEIVGIRFKNYSSSDEYREKPLWIGEYGLEPLKKFVDMFLDHISKNKPLR
ncbi:MAG TPA: hypothetical protein DCL08_03165 [Anaerolineaceae bacterium]|nr:hypothetical protein [Anaerolineaceae bacterium]